MIKNILHRKFGITTNEEFRVGIYEACSDKNKLYLLVPVGNMDDESIQELNLLSKHLVEAGDTFVCQFLDTREGERVIEWEEQRYCVLSTQGIDNRPVNRPGRKLAKFHYRGRSIPYEIKKISRIGMWKSFWEQRLDQMEKVWNEQLFTPPEDEFDRMFLESFPYYMGMTENAIQYLIDTEQDDEPVAVDSGTVCHVRFSGDRWNTNFLKNPFDWVFDHSSRDMAEWTRERYFRNIKTYEPEVRQFYRDYSSFITLSSFSWRLIYARLLFPLHYFETVEEYYITHSEQQKRMLEDKMSKYLEQSREYEEFLGKFYQLAGVPTRRQQIPEVEWLKK